MASLQITKYRRARDHGHSRADAAAYAGIGIGEAELVDREERRGLEPVAVRNEERVA